MKSFGYFAVCGLVVILVVGCGRQAAYTDGGVSRLCVGGVGKKAVMGEAERVLNMMHFKVGKLDEESGVLLSRPLTGAQFFEFWRDDVVGAKNTLESNIHTTRRMVEMEFGEEGGEVCVKCDVKVQRLSAVGREMVDGRRDSYSYERSGMRASLLRIDLEGMKTSWEDLGSDERLAGMILRRLEKSVAKTD